ncbi:hypothetical protein TUBRATIS_14340 [Tubulinosema ratisbonensis]|uniref:Uncharacterized protein n=1 Tax=Tubulinosema ratisbonensis TaxID=291195 RepID=A0A437ALX8_9MICR|nr:hypothetical protein TUBRATIS_14340 [Tubulinosema ratisbonensis]
MNLLPTFLIILYAYCCTSSEDLYLQLEHLISPATEQAYQCEFSRYKENIEDTLSSYENSFKTELTELYNSMKVVYEDTTKFLSAVTYLSNEILSTIEGSGDDSESD